MPRIEKIVAYSDQLNYFKWSQANGVGPIVLSARSSGGGRSNDGGAARAPALPDPALQQQLADTRRQMEELKAQLQVSQRHNCQSNILK